MTIADCVAMSSVAALVGFVLGLVVHDWLESSEAGYTAVGPMRIEIHEDLGDG